MINFTQLLCRWVCIASALCSGVVSAASLSVKVTDDKGGMLEHVALALVPLSGSKPVFRRDHIEIVQAAKTFMPTMSAVQTGTAIHFPNRDTVRHHVYSFSKAKSFELKLYIGTPAQPVVFDTPGIVVLGCNIHDHMVAYVMVADTPWLAVTDAQGQARMADLPEGDYELQYWHSRWVGRDEVARRRIRLSGAQSETLVIGDRP